MYRKRLAARSFVAAVVGLSLSAHVAAAQSSATEEEVTPVQFKCMALAKAYSDMSENMPMKIDQVTQLLSASAEYQKDVNECNVDLQYSVLEKPFIKGIVAESGGQMSESQAVAFLQSEQGKALVQDMMKKQNEAAYEEQEFQGVNFDLTYTMIGNKLSDMSFRLFE